MKHYDNIHCLEPGDGNAYVRPLEEEPKQSSTCEVFRLNPDGTKGEHLRTDPAFPEGWDDPKYNVGPKRVKEEESMVKPRDDKAEKMAEAKKLIAEGKSVMGAAKQIDIPQSTLVTWLAKEKDAPVSGFTPETEPDLVSEEIAKLKLDFANLTLASALGDVAKLKVIEYIVRM